MNRPRAIAKAVVIAVILFVVLTAAWNVVPRNITESPISYTPDEIEIEIDVDENMNLDVSIPPITFTSNLPSDIRDFTIDLYIGSGDERLLIGRYVLGTLAANSSVTVEGQKLLVPMVTLQVSIPNYATDGKISLQMTADVFLKYGKILGMNLFDIDLGLILTDQSVGATLDGPYIVDNQAKFSVTSSDPDSILSIIIRQFHAQTGGAGTVSCGGMAVDVVTDTYLKDSVTVTVNGDAKPPYEILRERIEPDGGLTFQYSYGEHSGTFHLTAEQAQELIDALVKLYGQEAPA